MRLERFDRGGAGNLDFAAAGEEIVVAIDERGPALFLGVFPADGGPHELAVIADRLVVRQNVVPEEAAGGVGQRVAAGVGIAAREAAEGALQVVGHIGFGGPHMAVGAQYPAAIEVVQKHELVDEFVAIGRHLAAEDAQIGIAFAALDVAKHLIVRTVFLDDVQHVLDERRLAVPLGQRPGRDVLAGRSQRADGFGHAVVSEHLFGVAGERLELGQRHQRNRA